MIKYCAFVYHSAAIENACHLQAFYSLWALQRPLVHHENLTLPKNEMQFTSILSLSFIVYCAVGNAIPGIDVTSNGPSLMRRIIRNGVSREYKDER